MPPSCGEGMPNSIGIAHGSIIITVPLNCDATVCDTAIYRRLLRRNSMSIRSPKNGSFNQLAIARSPAAKSVRMRSTS